MVNTKKRVKYAMAHRRVENARGKPKKCSVFGSPNQKIGNFMQTKLGGFIA